jgi:multiple sugar transport system substrate-binding protein
MFKKLICLMTAVILAASFTACGGGSNKSTPTQTYYEEKELGGSPNILFPGSSRINSKDQLVVYDNADGYSPQYVILDGEGKLAGKIPCSYTGMGNLFSLDSLDNIYAIVKNPDQSGNVSQKLCILNVKGETVNSFDLGSFSTSDEKTHGRGITDIAVDSSGNIYLADPEVGIRVLDKNGKEIKTLDSPGVFGICLDSDGNLVAFIINAPDISLNKINANSGKTEWKQKIPIKGGINIGGSAKVFFNNTDKCVYLPFGDEILKYDTSQKSMGTVLSFSDYTMMASGMIYSDMSMDSLGNIYVIANQMTAGFKSGSQNTSGSNTKSTVTQGTGSKPVVVQGSGNSSKPDIAPLPSDMEYSIFKYTLMKGVKKPDDSKVLTLAVSRDERFLDIAASKFQKDNPGYRIKIEAPQPGQDQQDQQNYINDLNTRILSGKGPDIFMSGLLPYDNYIPKNILADLSSLMASDKSFNTGDYYTNILDALKNNGKMYMLPVNFAFNGLIASKKVLDQEGISIDDSKWTWDDFKSIAEKLIKKDAGGSIIRTALPNISCNDMMDSIMIVNGSKFVDRSKKTASFDSPEFISILNVIKAFGDPKLANKGMKLGMPDVFDAAGRGSIVFYPTSMQDYINYSMMKTAFNSDISLLKLPSDGRSQADAFTSSQVYSISSNSKYKDKAWEFLKLLLSEDIQSQMDLNGFSVNKAAQQKKAQQAIDMTAKGSVKIMMKGNSKAITPLPITQADIDYVNGYIPGLTRYSGTDDKISQIVRDETAAFFNGDKSVEETVKLIQDKVKLYLGE